MKRFSVTLAVLLLVAFSSSAFSQDEEEERDILEIGFYGGLGVPVGGIGDFNDSLGAKNGWALGLDFGYFVTTNIIFGFSFTYTQFGVDGPDLVSDASHRLYSPSLYTKYYFIGESNWEPYLKVHVGLDNPKFTTWSKGAYNAISYDPIFAYGFGGGLFYYTADYSGLYIEANYHSAASEDSMCDYETDPLVFGKNIGVIDIHAGIRILIGSGD